MRRLAAAASIVALALVVAACGSGGSSGSGSSVDTSLLGTRQPASGAPVKIGVISDGQTAALDNTIQLRAADAVAKYLDDYRGGLGGRPIQLVPCSTQADPGKAADCATQLVQDNVTVTVMGETTSMPYVWKPLHDAGIPIVAFAATDASSLLDKDSTFILLNQTTGLIDTPVNIAKENHLKTVTVVVIDVPAATAFYDAVGKQQFAAAGMTLKVVKVPPGQADMTPQTTQIASSGPTEVHIIGNDAFCIAALNGLKAANFTGPITAVNQCITNASRKAVGSYLKGVTVGSPIAVGDSGDRDLRQWEAIAKTYGKNIDLSNSMGPTIYMTMMALREAVDGISGDITSKAIIKEIHSAPEKPLPAGGGLKFRCNGKASALTPSVCVRGTLLTTLDSAGQPTLPYKLSGASPIES
jgi:branched-chain amino acid transport system substrate-binding protein